MQVNFGSRSGQTALHWAASRGNLEASLCLVAFGAQVDAVDQDGMTPLLAAVKCKRKFMALTLLEFGANVLHVDKGGQSVMHFGAGTGSADMLRLLSRRGANASQEDSQGLMPIHRACMAGHFEAALFLAEELGCSTTAAIAKRHALADPSALAGLGYGPETHSLLPIDLALMHVYIQATKDEGSSPIGPVNIPPPAVSLAPVETLSQSLGRCMQFLRHGGGAVADPYFWRLRAIRTCPSEVWMLRSLTLRGLHGPVAAPVATGLGAGDTIPKITRMDLVMEAGAHYMYGLLGMEAPTSNWQVRHLPFAAWVLLVVIVIANLGLNDMRGVMRHSWMVPLEGILFGVVLAVEAVILCVEPGTVDPYGVGWEEGEPLWQALPTAPQLLSAASRARGKPLHGAVAADGSLVDPVTGTAEGSRVVSPSETLLMVDPQRIKVAPDGLTTATSTSRNPKAFEDFMIVQVTPVDDSPVCVAAAQLANALLAMGVAQGAAGFNWHNPKSDLTLEEFKPELFIPSAPSHAMVALGGDSSPAGILRAVLSGAQPAAPKLDYQAIPRPCITSTWSNTCQFLLQRKLSHVERLLVDASFASGVSAELRDEMTCFTTECVQPPRSKYDTITRRRYHKFDHYCPWVHRTVSANTHPWFVVYCTAQFLCCAIGVTLWMMQLMYLPRAASMSWPQFIWHGTAGRGVLSLLALFCHSFGTALCAGLLAFHVPSAMAGNVTTNEASNAGRYAHMWRFSPPAAVAKAKQFLDVSRSLTGPNADAQMLSMLKGLPYFKRDTYSPFAWKGGMDNTREMFGLRGARRMPPGRVRHLRVTAEALGSVAAQVAHHAPEPSACGSGCSHSHGHSHGRSPAAGAAAGASAPLVSAAAAGTEEA